MKKSIFIIATLILSNLRIYAQTWQWVRAEAAGPKGYGVAADNAGNVFLVGTTTGTAVVGTFSNLTNLAGGVIAKYDANGNVLWAKFITGCTAYNVACDATGNAFLCGYFSNTLAIGNQTLVSNGGQDIFVAKYSPVGNVMWAASTGGAGTDISNCVNVDTQGNVLVSGYVGVGSFTFGPSAISNTGTTKYFVAKFNNGGTPQWAISGAMGTTISNYISTDASNNIYLTGAFSSISSVGAGTYAANASNDFYLAKFNSAGLPAWTVIGNGAGSDVGYCVRVHPSGDILVSGGYTSATFSLVFATLSNAGSSDPFLARFTSAGGLIWAITGGGTGNEIAYTMAAHPGGVYMAGSLGTTSFVIGTSTLTPPNTVDNMFLCGIDNSGNVAYSQFINGGGDDVMALDIYNGCNLYLGGDIFTPTMTLGAFTVTHSMPEVLFVAKFNTGINSPTLNLSPSYTICQGSTMTLTAGGAATYTWDNGPNTNSFVVNPAATTTYVIAGTSTAGCSTKSVVTVVVVPNSVTLTAVSGTPFCPGNTATLSIAGATTFTWSGGIKTQSIIVSPVSTSVYTVSGTSTTGCLYTESFTVNVLVTTPVSANPNISTICSGSSVTLTAGGADLYSWSTGSQQPSISVSPLVTTTYIVTGTNTTNSCVTKATVQVSVNSCAGTGEIKSEMQLIIYPNPGREELYIRADKSLEGSTLLLRNVQGELIFSRMIVSETESDSYRTISELPPGVYFITIERFGVTELTKKMVVE